VSSTGRYGKLVVAESVHPEYRQTIATYLKDLGVEVVTVGTPTGVIKPQDLAAAVDDKIACIVVQQPNFFGCIEDAGSLASIAHDSGALVVAAFDPISLGLIKRPGDWGADIAVAEGHTLGTNMQYGGPYLGIMACREKLIRRMPGRIAGETVDRRGKRCFVLTLQTREQHIRRERATSNICTSTQLIALQATIYVQALGPRGLRRVAELCYERAHDGAARIDALPGYGVERDEPFFHEFVVRTPKPVADINGALLARGIIGGLDVSDYTQNKMLLCVTEMNSRVEIDALVEALRDASD
jgi:glycine dehydrogenase subunit 1